MAFIMVCAALYMALPLAHTYRLSPECVFFRLVAALLWLLHHKQQLYSLTPTTKLLQMVNNFAVSFTVDAASQLIKFMSLSLTLSRVLLLLLLMLLQSCAFNNVLLLLAAHIPL